MRKSLSVTMFLVLVAAITTVFSSCARNSNDNNPSVVSAEPTPDKAAIEAQLRALEYD